MKHIIKKNMLLTIQKFLHQSSVSFSFFRFQEDLTAKKQKPGNSVYPKKQTIKPNRSRASSSKMSPCKPCKTPKEGVLSRIFSEEYDSMLDVKKNLFDPHGPRIHRWNRIFLVACLVSLFLDPLLFYLPATSKMCIKLTTSLEAVFTVLRSLADVFYFVQIFVKFRTAFVAPSSRVFGRGELVIEPSEIASRYLKRSFWLDFLAALPLPQVNLHLFFHNNFIIRFDLWKRNLDLVYHILLTIIITTALIIPRLFLINTQFVILQSYQAVKPLIFFLEFIFVRIPQTTWMGKSSQNHHFVLPSHFFKFKNVHSS